MGNTCDGGSFSRCISVATLNYSGITLSPFQFYNTEYEQKLKQISKIFLSLIPQSYQDFDRNTFNWNIGQIDKVIKKRRYTPMYRSDVGINLQTKKFMNQDQFKKKWDEVFEQIFDQKSYYAKIIQVEKQMTKEQNTEQNKLKMAFRPIKTYFSLKERQQQLLQHKENIKRFDFIMFLTCLKYVFGQQRIKNIGDAQSLDIKKYQKEMNPFYQLTCLDQKKKVEIMTKNLYIIDADIFFFQQYSKEFRQSLIQTGNYKISEESSKDDTMIVIKKKVLFNQKQIKMEQLCNKYSLKSGKWPQHTSIMVFDNIITIGIHFSSKKNKNLEQKNKFMDSLKSLKLALPTYDIIVGGNINSFQNNFPSFNFYPTKKQQITTFKRRTMAQCQFDKGDQQIKQSKDKIITTMRMSNQSLKLINGDTPKQGELLPSNSHPFDHYIVCCTLQQQIK